MPSDLPQTPQSPSHVTDLPSKLTASPMINTSLPTPAHSINGSMSSLSATEPHPQVDELTNKRKRDVEDVGDREQKKIHIEDSRLSIEDLHLDVGEKYFFCRTPHPPARPDFRDDLFVRYGLTSIAASVARVTPDGKKNTIRKTYKGYIKSLGLVGNIDADKKEFGEPDTLFSMLKKPQEGWDAENVRKIEDGLSESVIASLPKALAMAKGPIKKDLWNPSILGEVKGETVQTPVAASPVIKTPITNPSVARAAKADAARPKRNIKKRGYNDKSFEGYGEGYIDDEADTAGYSTGDADERGPRKKPKSGSFQGPARQGSYGPGMVGA